MGVCLSALCGLIRRPGIRLAEHCLAQQSHQVVLQNGGGRSSCLYCSIGLGVTTVMHVNGGLLECLCLSDPLFDQGLARYASKYVVAWRYSRFCFGSLVVALMSVDRFVLRLSKRRCCLLFLFADCFVPVCCVLVCVRTPDPATSHLSKKRNVGSNRPNQRPSATRTTAKG